MSKYPVIAYFFKERVKEQHKKEPRRETHMSLLGSSLGFDQAELSLLQWLCKEFRKQLVPTLLLLCPPPTIGKQ